MTLSSTSRQQRKSLLPKPRPSSGRRHGVASGDSTTSRIARRVPSPMLATSYNNGLVAQAARVVPPRPTADCNFLLPEFGSRRALAGPPPSRIPWSAGLTSSSWSPEQSEASSLVSSTDTSPSQEAKKRVDGNNVLQYRVPPPASADIKHGRLTFKGQEGQGRTIPAQHQDTEENRDSAPKSALAAGAPPARYPASTGRRRPASASTALTLALTSNGSSRVNNGSPGDRDGDGISALAWKKSAAFTSTSSSVSGKENRRPRRMLARVPPPPVVPTIPPRSVRRSVVDQPSLRTLSPLRGTLQLSRPLVIRKQLPSSHSLATAAAEGTPRVRSASGGSGVLPVVGLVPAGIQALIGDIDRFAKEWAEMFDELSAPVAEDPGEIASKFGASIRARPTGQPEDAGPFQADNPAMGKGTPTRKRLLPVSSESVASVNTLQASSNGETAHFDVTPVNLARRQHRDKAMVKEAPAEDKLERDLPEVASASATDPLALRAVLRNASLRVAPQATRNLPSLPEINQSPVISCSHPVEMTSVVLPNRRNELADFLESPSAAPRSIDTPRRYGIIKQARYHPPKGPSSPPSNVVSLSPVSAPYSSSPWVNLRAPEFSTPRTINAASDALPARTSSLRGLRAIFKRTSAGLTGGHRQRAESLKDRISEPRVLSLGSVSISNLRDAGLASGCAEREESTMTSSGDLARIMAVK